MKHPLLCIALLCSAGVPTPVPAGLLQCAQANGIPLFTDTAPARQPACKEFVLDPMALSVNDSLPLDPATRKTSARTLREIQRAQRSRQAIQAEARQKRNACQRARTRAAAAWTLPLGRRAALNRAAYYACQ